MSMNRWHNHHLKMRNKILAFVTTYTSTYGYGPTYREIGDGTDIRSTSTVSNYVRELVEEGALNCDCSKARTLTPAMSDEPREIVQQRICVQVADGGKLYLDCVLEKPRSSCVRVSFEGVLDAKALKGPVGEIVGVYASDD